MDKGKSLVIYQFIKHFSGLILMIQGKNICFAGMTCWEMRPASYFKAKTAAKLCTNL